MVREQRERALGDHPAVGHHDDPADAEALPQPRDHRDEGRPIRRVPGEDVPGHGPTVAIHGHAEDDLRLVGPPIARVAAAAQRRLGVAPDERARGVEEEQVQLLREEIPVLQEQVALQVLPHRGEEPADGAVEVVQGDPREARALHRLQPLRALQVTARGTQALQGKGERRALDIEGEAPVGGQAFEDGGHALLVPEPAEDQRGTPGATGVRLQAGRAHPLDHPEVLAEAGEAAHEPVEGARRHERVAPAEGGEHPLADRRALPH